MVRTRAMRTWLGLGLHALGVAIFSSLDNDTSGYCDALHIRCPSAAPVGDRLPNCRIVPPLVIAESRS